MSCDRPETGPVPQPSHLLHLSQSNFPAFIGGLSYLKSCSVPQDSLMLEITRGSGSFISKFHWVNSLTSNGQQVFCSLFSNIFCHFSTSGRTHRLPTMCPESINMLHFLKSMSNTTGEYRKPVVPLEPLSFETVMKGKQLSTASPLFEKLCALLPIILRYAGPSSLATLALVNSDCRQLARSAQFTNICFDYSEQSHNLLSLLMKERGEGISYGKDMPFTPGIAACIRQVTIATHPLHFYSRHGIIAGLFSLDEEKQDELLRKASQAYFDLYLS
jgi:hypothetical protein